MNCTFAIAGCIHWENNWKQCEVTELLIYAMKKRHYNKPCYTTIPFVLLCFLPGQPFVALWFSLFFFNKLLLGWEAQEYLLVMAVCASMIAHVCIVRHIFITRIHLDYFAHLVDTQIFQRSWRLLQLCESCWRNRNMKKLCYGGNRDWHCSYDMISYHLDRTILFSLFCSRTVLWTTWKAIMKHPGTCLHIHSV